MGRKGLEWELCGVVPSTRCGRIGCRELVNDDSTDMATQSTRGHGGWISMRLIGLLAGLGSQFARILPAPVDYRIHQMLDVLHSSKIAQYLVHIPARARQVQLVADDLGQIT